MAPGAAAPAADLQGPRAPPPLARPAPQRSRARQLLRDEGDRRFKGRNPRELERGVGKLRPQDEGEGGGRGKRRRRRRRWAGYVRGGRSGRRMTIRWML